MLHKWYSKYHTSDIFKPYCGYKYTRPCMINHIWDLKQLKLQVNGNFYFICIGSTELFKTGRERKIQNKNMRLQRDSNPRNALHDK